MKIEIHHIPSQGVTLRFEKAARWFAVIKELMEHGEFQAITPVQISLEAVPEKEMFKVTGKLSTTLRLTCSRCLIPFDSLVTRKFRLRYSRQILEDLQPGGADGVELTAQQIGMYPFQGEAIDFTDAVQEQFVLSLPYRPLCHEACKGLCARCGADLNQTTCTCGTGSVDSPFAVLKNLKLPE